MNVWHFNSASAPISLDANNILAALDTFYNSIADTYSENTLTGNIGVKMFDLVDDPPRVPILEDSIEMTGMAVADALPTECAVVMSFQGLPISGVNQRRRRGRLFFGPCSSGISTTATGLVLVTNAAAHTIAVAGTAMIGAGEGETWSWIVFSPSTAGNPPWDTSLLEQASAPVHDGWVDNAFDTQRRRGTEATARELFP